MSDGVELLVGRRLRSRRKLMGMTQGDLARVCGISFQQVHKYEIGASRMSAVMLFRIGCALGVEIGYFFAGADRSETLAPSAGAAAMSQAA